MRRPCGDGGMATAAQINQTHTIDPTLRFAVRSSDGQATSDSARLTVGR